MYSNEITQRFNARPLIQMYNTAINGLSNKDSPINDAMQSLFDHNKFLTEFKKLGEVKKAVEGMRDAAIERMDYHDPILYRGNQIAVAMVNAAFKAKLVNTDRSHLAQKVIKKASSMVTGLE
jgi:hypothetical protein